MSPIEFGGILTALLAHGRACQNWLATDAPDLGRLRRSVDALVHEGADLISALSRPRTPGPRVPQDGEQVSITVVRPSRSGRREPVW
jgi:hypothetical protein